MTRKVSRREAARREVVKGIPGVHSLFVVNQVTGPLMRELLEDLEDYGIRCTVLTGWVDSDVEDDLRFRIVRSVRLRKFPLWKRLLTWSAFAVHAAVALVRRRNTAALVVTNPPIVPLMLPFLTRLTGLRYVLLCYDIYPDIAERMGLLAPGGRVARVWRRLSGRAMRAAQGVITLGSHMADTLRAHLPPGQTCPIEVIPNWADTRVIEPLAKTDNPFARRHGLEDKFVVMYSGSFGATHDIDSILEAADRLQDLQDVQFMLIGGGTRQREVAEQVECRGFPNVTLLPLQPFSALPFSLASADCAIVCLDEGYEGVAVPSKTYYALAGGAAILAVSPPETELTDLIAESGCGIHILPRSPDGLEKAIRTLYCDRPLLTRCRAASRAVAEKRFSRTRLTKHYERFLRQCLSDV